MARLLKLALVAPTLVLAHQLVFLARYGSVYGEALAHAGHGPAWTGAVAVVAIGTGLLVAGFVVGTVRIARELRRLGGRPAALAPIRSPDVAHRAVGPAVIGTLRTAASLIATVLVGLTIQENLEHAAAGLPMPGLGILASREYPFAVGIVAVVSLVVVLVATLLTWRHGQLTARLRQLREQAAWGRAARVLGKRVAAPLPPRPTRAARQLGRRAPPLTLPA